MEYKIVHGYSADELEWVVTKELSKGWEPQGNLVVDGELYLQPIVRREEEIGVTQLGR